ncbi:MAG: TRAP transporter, DctM subunit, partial [Rhodobacteraceae bacterium HLUCCA24]
MEWYFAMLILVGSIAGFIVIGMPVALAFLTANIIGTLIFMPNILGMLQIVENSTDLVTKFTLAPVPLFILMGGLFFHTGLAKIVFDALDRLLGAIPGRLSFLAVGGGTVFAALTGSSLANAAMLGSLLIPEMERRRYKPHMAIGPILGVGGLAIIIPPSAIAVLLAGIANVDVGKLLIAGLAPGLVLAGLFACVIAIQLWRDPDAAPRYDMPPVPLSTKLRLLFVDTMPIFIIIAMVIGLIVFGIATPTESAAFGVLGVLIAAALFRRLSFGALAQALRGTVLVGGMVFFIVMGSAVFSQLLAFSGA